MADQIAEMDVLKPFVHDDCSRNDIAPLINSSELKLIYSFSEILKY